MDARPSGESNPISVSAHLANRYASLVESEAYARSVTFPLPQRPGPFRSGPVPGHCGQAGQATDQRRGPHPVPVPGPVPVPFPVPVSGPVMTSSPGTRVQWLHNRTGTGPGPSIDRKDLQQSGEKCFPGHLPTGMEPGSFPGSASTSATPVYDARHYGHPDYQDPGHGPGPGGYFTGPGAGFTGPGHGSRSSVPGTGTGTGTGVWTRSQSGVWTRSRSSVPWTGTGTGTGTGTLLPGPQLLRVFLLSYPATPGLWTLAATGSP